MKVSKFLILFVFCFSTILSRPFSYVTVANNTEKSIFVVTTFKDTFAFSGFRVKPDSVKVFYYHSFMDVFLPKNVYIFENGKKANYKDTTYKFSGYLEKFKIDQVEVSNKCTEGEYFTYRAYVKDDFDCNLYIDLI